MLINLEYIVYKYCRQLTPYQNGICGVPMFICRHHNNRDFYDYVKGLLVAGRPVFIGVWQDVISQASIFDLIILASDPKYVSEHLYIPNMFFIISKLKKVTKSALTVLLDKVDVYDRKFGEKKYNAIMYCLLSFMIRTKNKPLQTYWPKDYLNEYNTHLLLECVKLDILGSDNMSIIESFIIKKKYTNLIDEFCLVKSIALHRIMGVKN